MKAKTPNAELKKLKEKLKSQDIMLDYLECHVHRLLALESTILAIVEAFQVTLPRKRKEQLRR